MNFQSVEFIVFFGIVFVLYWVLKKPKLQNILLLVASYYFASKVNYWFGVILLVTTIVNYVVGILIERNPEKKYLLTIGVLANVLLLGFFKYFGFFTDSINAVLAGLRREEISTNLKIIVPLGISFFTFTNISYLVDVAKEKIKASTNFIDFALFISFFPKFLSGPIERAVDLIPQLSKQRTLTASIASSSLTLILWGFFKKLVIADNLGVAISKIFFLESAALPLIGVGTVLFAFQLYADFSAYSDIAVGVAKLLGFNIVNNFNFPYISKAPSEFWKRWHISLSTWIKDYIYIPLGGSREGTVRTYANLIIAFGISGLWHGASWNYVLWGVYWGVLLIGERLLRPITSKLKPSFITSWLSTIITFLLVNIGWLMFYETDFHYLKKYALLIGSPISQFDWQMAAYIFFNNAIYLVPLAINYLIWRYLSKSLKKNDMLRFVLQHTANALMIVFIVLLSTTVKGDFIYADF